MLLSVALAVVCGYDLSVSVLYVYGLSSLEFSCQYIDCSDLNVLFPPSKIGAISILAIIWQVDFSVASFVDLRFGGVCYRVRAREL